MSSFGYLNELKDERTRADDLATSLETMTRKMQEQSDRADELAKHCETHEEIIESLTRDQMANKHWKSEWEQAYPAMLQAQQRADEVERFSEHHKQAWLAVGVLKDQYKDRAEAADRLAAERGETIARLRTAISDAIRWASYETPNISQGEMRMALQAALSEAVATGSTKEQSTETK